LPTLLKVIAKNFKSIATTIDAIRNNLGSKTVVRSGVTSASIPAGSLFSDVTINYTGFSTAPSLVVTAQHNSGAVTTAKLQTATETTAVVRVNITQSVSATMGVIVRWIAVGN